MLLLLILVQLELQLNAQAGQVSEQVIRTVRVELVGDGAAPVQVTITVQTNTDVNSPGAGDA